MNVYDAWVKCLDPNTTATDRTFNRFSLEECPGSSTSTKSSVSYSDCYDRNRFAKKEEEKKRKETEAPMKPKKSAINFPDIKKVHFNDPVTVVLWTDGTKTIVRCQDGDIYDPEKGLAMAIAKKALGNKGNYCDVFKKWLPEEEPDIREYEFTLNCNPVQAISDALSKLTFGNATVSFEVKKEQDDLAEDLRDEIFNNAVPANRIRGEEKK